MKNETIWGLKQELHDLSHKLLAFSIENRSDEDWARFYGATDTIDDIATALSEFRELDRVPSYLERIGFLQAMIILQDAVENISKSLGLNWTVHDDKGLKEIREIRDGLRGIQFGPKRARIITTFDHLPCKT